jgi:hypothetical protein
MVGHFVRGAITHSAEAPANTYIIACIANNDNVSFYPNYIANERKFERRRPGNMFLENVRKMRSREKNAYINQRFTGIFVDQT